ncbi:MAG: ABC transporter substrate-binding protein [Chloroflexota bacterium]
MHKRITLLTLSLLLILAAVPVFAQDDSGEEATAEAPEAMPEITWECPEGYAGQTLNVYNWSTYIGETTVSTFEELCDVEVVYDVYDSNETLIARLRQGNPGYDVAFPSDYAIAIMIRGELVQTLDYTMIPNIDNVAERWRGLYFDPEDQYSAPYLWGTFGVAYNVEAVGEEITSWEQVWAHEGPVAWIDDNRSTIGVALQSLGYDPNSQDPEEVAEARDYLIERGGNVVTISDDDGQALLARGEVDIAMEYNGDVFQIMADCECDDYAYVLPEEGSVVDVAAMVVLEDAPNPELAHVFIDYVLDPVVNAMIVNDVLYATTNQAAVDSGIIDEMLLENAAIFPPEEALENLFFLRDVAEAEQAYNDAWDEIIILIGS